MKLIKEYLPYVVIIIIIVLIRQFIVTPVRVDGESMDPTLSNGEILILNKLDNSFELFDIVVIKYGTEKIIKRIIGLPGDYIEYKNNILYINNEIVEENFLENDTKTSDFKLSDLGYKVISDGFYFVVGDNRDNSLDSRIIGLVKKSDIIGTTKLALFPFDKFGILE
ncbi:MAG: signal peptidase I [Bacilli bacterium]